MIIQFNFIRSRAAVLSVPMSAGDGIFTYRHGIAVAQLVFFSVSLFLAVYFKYGHRNGWFCIGVFSIFRLVGAGCMLGTITNGSSGVLTGVFVCESFGLAFILFLLLELLHRAYVYIEQVLHLGAAPCNGTSGAMFELTSLLIQKQSCQHAPSSMVTLAPNPDLGGYGPGHWRICRRVGEPVPSRSHKVHASQLWHIHWPLSHLGLHGMVSLALPGHAAPR
jgi:hypothetical protein